MTRWQGWMALFLLWHMAFRDAVNGGGSLTTVIGCWVAAGVCLVCTLLEIHRYWWKGNNTMLDALTLQFAEMIRDGHEPAGFIMTPRQLTRFLAAVKDTSSLQMVDDPRSSGWQYDGVPIYRSYEISGPCVVSRDVLDVLRKCGRWSSVGGERGPMQQVLGSQACEADLRPLLF